MRSRGLHHWDFRGNTNGLLRGADLKRYIHGCYRAHCQRNPGPLRNLEAGCFSGQVIAANRQLLKAIKAALVRGRCPRQTGRRVCRGDFGAGYRGAARVGDSSVEARSTNFALSEGGSGSETNAHQDLQSEFQHIVILANQSRSFVTIC